MGRAGGRAIVCALETGLRWLSSIIDPATEADGQELAMKHSILPAVAGLLVALGAAVYATSEMGRAGIEPATLGLRVPCSTS
jgi:hypothetical protein